MKPHAFIPLEPPFGNRREQVDDFGPHTRGGYSYECARCREIAIGPYSSHDFNHPDIQAAWLDRHENRFIDPDCDRSIIRQVLDR